MSNYLKTLAGDLLNLEINTIVKQNTANDKMPSVRRKALFDIAEGFRFKLAENGFCSYQDGTFEPNIFNFPHPKKFQWWYGGEFSFVEISYFIKEVNDFLEQKIAVTQDKIALEKLQAVHKLLIRFQSQTSNIIGLFKKRRQLYAKKIAAKEEGFSIEKSTEGMTNTLQDAFPSQLASMRWNNDIDLADINTQEDIDLSPEEITLIRKIWEIGSQQVLLQTVVQIDGDVTSYIANQLLEMPADLQRMILNIHSESVQTGTKSWSSLFNTVINLAGKAYNEIFKGK
jgi:hypothetical protein